MPGSPAEPPTPARSRRINVVGTSGSGKTTLARQIADTLGLPCHEMDACYWQPDWTPSDEAQFLERIGEICNDEAWVLDGNYSVTQTIKWRRCQLVVTRRTLARSISGVEVWPGTGNRETLARSLFARDAVVWWAVRTWRRNRRRYLAAMADPGLRHIRFVRLRSDADVTAFLKSLTGNDEEG